MRDVPDRSQPPVGLLTEEAPSAHVLPRDAVQGLGELGTTNVELARLAETGSLLEAYNFSDAERQEIAGIVDEAEADPRVDLANTRLHEWRARGGDCETFADEVFTHQLDVAEVAVGLGMRLGIDVRWLRYFALAGLTHDLDKGNPDTAPVFMKKGEWDREERERAEGHPVAAEKIQQELGFENEVRYLTGQHHKYLLPNPKRHVKGGYGGSSIAPPESEAKEWESNAKFLSYVDTVVALARVRGYKGGIPMLSAIDIGSRELDVPEEFALKFRDALAVDAGQPRIVADTAA